MTEEARRQLMREPLTGSLATDIPRLKQIFAKEQDADVQFRAFRFFEADACLIYIDGLVNADWLQDFVLQMASFWKTTITG